MIGLVTGKITELSAPMACIMTAGGVGYEIEMPIPTFCTLTLGGTATLHTHLYVREDAQLLFGFIDKQEKEIFRKLIKINGVGAKMALAILSTLSVSQLKEAIEYDNDTALTKVAGIGKKTAQRLIIELKGKFSEFGGTASDLLTPSVSDNPQNPMHIIAETESALVSLGYKDKEAQAAIKAARQALDNDGQDITTSTLLKASLKQLSGF